MGQRIFLAGASGAIGRRLTPLLCEAGHHVVGMTRSTQVADELRALGAEPVVVDVFDAPALMEAVAGARPDIAMHQLTDLAMLNDPARAREARIRNARLRNEGTHNLVRAALTASVGLMVAQSIAWAYTPGPEPHGEDDALDMHADEERAVSVRGVAALEKWVLGSPPLVGVVLRYGQLYGPGTGRDLPTGTSPLHVDAAAYAALLALDQKTSGIFNIAEPNLHVATDKARTELGWHDAFRLPE